MFKMCLKFNMHCQNKVRLNSNKDKDLQRKNILNQVVIF